MVSAAVDVDECRADNGQCEQVCVNAPGSLYCDCTEGYQLETDRKRCRKSKKLLHCQQELMLSAIIVVPLLVIIVSIVETPGLT